MHLHVVEQTAWPRTTTPLVHVHTSTCQELSIESRESLFCTVSGTSIMTKYSALDVQAQLCMCRSDGYTAQQFNKV